jgi:hypothetical protein
MTLNRLVKRHIIAAAVIQGVAIATVARQIGVSRSWASREANSPGVRNWIAGLIAKRGEQFGWLLDRALEVVHEALGAETVVRRNDDAFVTVPDHKVRMEAVRVFSLFLAAFETLVGTANA